MVSKRFEEKKMYEFKFSDFEIHHERFLYHFKRFFTLFSMFSSRLTVGHCYILHVREGREHRVLNLNHFNHSGPSNYESFYHRLFYTFILKHRQSIGHQTYRDKLTPKNLGVIKKNSSGKKKQKCNVYRDIH